nr:type II toxin-antitoxin system HicA family toxin [uncultured Selenomonas sp.]
MRFKELDRLLKKNGWQPVRSKGSHQHYQKDGIAKTLTVPNHPGDINPFIVKSVLKEAGIKL